jgi:hypothetical protein
MSRADAKGVACRQGAQGKHRASGGEARELYQGGHVVEMKMKGGTMRRVNMEKREGGRDERGGREGAWEGWRQTSNGVSLYDLDGARERVGWTGNGVSLYDLDGARERVGWGLGTDRHERRGTLMGRFV